MWLTVQNENKSRYHYELQALGERKAPSRQAIYYSSPTFDLYWSLKLSVLTYLTQILYTKYT